MMMLYLHGKLVLNLSFKGEKLSSNRGLIMIKTFGIYSIPKSGNTWIREIIRGLFETNIETKKAVPDIYIY